MWRRGCSLTAAGERDDCFHGEAVSKGEGRRKHGHVRGSRLHGGSGAEGYDTRSEKFRREKGDGGAMRIYLAAFRSELRPRSGARPGHPDILHASLFETCGASTRNSIATNGLPPAMHTTLFFIGEKGRCTHAASRLFPRDGGFSEGGSGNSQRKSGGVMITVTGGMNSVMSHDRASRRYV